MNLIIVGFIALMLVAGILLIVREINVTLKDDNELLGMAYRRIFQPPKKKLN